MRFNIKQVTIGEFKGKWVAMDSRGCFFEDMVGDTKEQARVNALMDRAPLRDRQGCGGEAVGDAL